MFVTWLEKKQLCQARFMQPVRAWPYQRGDLDRRT